MEEKNGFKTYIENGPNQGAGSTLTCPASM